MVMLSEIENFWMKLSVPDLVPQMWSGTRMSTPLRWRFTPRWSGEISMRPSSPSGVGRIGDRFVFLLPGNPVSCLCAYEFFAGPTLRALGGRPRRWPHRRVTLPLSRKIVSAVGRTDYVRVAVEAGHVVPLATSGASILSSTVRASGCVIVPREQEGMPDGTRVEVVLYDEEVPEGLA